MSSSSNFWTSRLNIKNFKDQPLDFLTCKTVLKVYLNIKDIKFYFVITLKLSYLKVSYLDSLVLCVVRFRSNGWWSVICFTLCKKGFQDWPMWKRLALRNRHNDYFILLSYWIYIFRYNWRFYKSFMIEVLKLTIKWLIWQWLKLSLCQIQSQTPGIHTESDSRNTIVNKTDIVPYP